MVTEELELAEFFQSDGVSEVNVGRGGIHAKLDAERSPELELFQQFLFGKNIGGAGSELGELLFG